jgi:uncharacterized protein HemX
MFLSFLLGPLGKIGIALALVAALSAGGWYAWTEHNNRVATEARAAMDAAASKAIIDQQALDAAKVRDALDKSTAELNALSVKFTNARKQINAAPRTVACATSAAVRASIDGLYDDSGPSGAVQKSATSRAAHAVQGAAR